MEPYSAPLGLAASDLSGLASQPEGMVIDGRLLYPRFYRQGGGEPARNEPFVSREYPRMAFILVGPRGSVPVILARESPVSMPDASDAIVVGCLTQHDGAYVLSAAGVALPTQGLAYARQPSAPLECPLPEPVCDGNGNCH
jgi:hypothetical protein